MTSGGGRGIGDYALIGNARTAALVSRDGSVDWLCLPRFDSPSVFGALLDPRAGHFSIRPKGEFAVDRRYVPDTNVVETTFTTNSGRATIRDLIPVAEGGGDLLPEHELLRELEGLEGAVELFVEYRPRPRYAVGPVRLDDRGPLGVRYTIDEGLLTLRGDIDLAVDGGTATGHVRLGAGARRHLSLAFDRDAPAVLVGLGEAAHRRVADTEAWWRAWADRCEYDGPYRQAVVRSALVLKLMTYAPSGAIIAAPTTSLPEVLGGERNWDYRYCWLRDASFTVRALFGLGYREEGEAFLSWLLHATRLTHPELRIVYDVFGGTHLPERELSHMAGYAGSRPVRVGNGAGDQLQLDVYGEVVDAAVRYVAHGGSLDGDQKRQLIGFGETVCRRWREPDEGIWEPRGGPRQHTHSKVLAWVALDGLLELHAARAIHVPVERFQREADAIRETVERRGWNAEADSYTQELDSQPPELDASLLTLPLYGYLPAGHQRIRGTVATIRRELASGVLVHRYRPGAGDDGLPGSEAAFGICSFWLVEAMALAGDVEPAVRLFEEMLGYATDLGLWSEEIDPVSGIPLGNFPQALTHIGLINAALTLKEASHANRERP